MSPCQFLHLKHTQGSPGSDHHGSAMRSSIINLIWSHLFSSQAISPAQTCVGTGLKPGNLSEHCSGSRIGIWKTFCSQRWWSEIGDNYRKLLQALWGNVEPVEISLDFGVIFFTYLFMKDLDFGVRIWIEPGGVSPTHHSGPFPNNVFDKVGHLQLLPEQHWKN